METKLFVGNINWEASDKDLQDLFSNFGVVEQAVIIRDKVTGRSRGFGFVTFGTEDEARAAIEALDGKDFMGRKLFVNKARPQQR